MEYQKLKEEIKEHEGYRAMVYNDILGKRTIGYGHLCRDDEKWEDGKNYDHRHLEKIFEYDKSFDLSHLDNYKILLMLYYQKEL